MGDAGKRKPDPRPVDLSEPGAVIPAWYWRISPHAWLWDPMMPAPAPRARPRLPPGALATVMLMASLASR